MLHTTSKILPSACPARDSAGRVLMLTVAVYVALCMGGVANGAEHARDEIVAACIIGEAGGEGTTGMIAVANVISNRAHGDAEKFVGVVLARKQFSAMTGDLDAIIAKARQHPKWNLAVQLAESAALGSLDDVTDHATHYYSDSISAPYWTRGMRQTAKIGHHTFFKG